MLDSINFIIHNTEKLNFKRLKKLGITIKHFQKINPNTVYINSCYEFKYKNIEFKMNNNTGILTIITNVHKILNKKDITLSDKIIYEQKIQAILIEILGTNNFELEVSRIDYCVDLHLTPKEMDLYLLILHNNVNKYCYMKSDKIYQSSIYLKTKNGKTNINAYNRGAKTGLKEDENILRVEVQCKRKLLKTEFEKFGITKDLDNYWSREAMKIYYFDLLKNFLHTGNYYQLEDAYKIINANYTGSMRSKLKKFLRDIVRYWGLGYLSDSSDPTIAKLGYTKAKIKNYCEKLDVIGVNPIPLQKWASVTESNFPSLYNRLVEIAEEKYFK